MEKDVEEADTEMDVGEVPPTRDSVPEQAPALPATMLVTSSIWVGGQDDQVAGLGISLRAQGKAPARQAEWPPLAEMDEELACRL